LRPSDRRPAFGGKQGRDESTRRCPVLVLGIGNILLRDEGVGVRVVEMLQTMELPSTVEVFDGATAGVDLLDVMADRRKIIVVDAVQADGPPGMVFRFSPSQLQPQEHVSLSLHQIGLLEALRMAELIGCPPEQVVIFGVRPKDVGCGLDLSTEVTQAAGEVVQLVLSELGA
jgi:hydrogenase maturation protease